MRTGGRSAARLVVGGLVVGALLDFAAAPARAELCGGALEDNNFQRPVDYANPQVETANINLVERFHFNSEVEALLKGTTAPLPMDIAYTLRQIPNHYRALNAMARFQLRTPRPVTATYWTADCYFERALAFRPEDGVLYMLYGIYLQGRKDYPSALEAYRRAESLRLESPELVYNMGLLFTEMANYADARSYAHKAYAGGYPLQGLRHRLERANQWQDAPPAPPAATPPAEAPANHEKPQ